MELKEVVGRRRSIRFYLPHRPVERAKVQKMLEAARRASCVGNVGNTSAIVIWRADASPELMQAITPPLGYQQMQTAPCFIFWYADTNAYQIDNWIERLCDLADQRRLGVDAEATKGLINRALKPFFEAMWQEAAVSPLAMMDVGQAVAQATLVAYDEGLGTCLMSSPRLEQVAELLELPETAIPVCIQSVGYPAESWEAGGQTKKRPFADLFFENTHGVAFEPDASVEDELRAEGMLQAEAPLPWRDEELMYVMRALGLQGEFLGAPGS